MDPPVYQFMAELEDQSEETTLVTSRPYTTLSQRLREMAQREAEANPMSREEEEAIFNRVLQESLRQKEKDDERRRMAGMPTMSGAEASPAPASANDPELNSWLQMTFPSRLQSALNLGGSKEQNNNKSQSPDKPKSGPTSGAQSQFDDHLQLVTEFSRQLAEQNRNGSEAARVGPGHDNDPPGTNAVPDVYEDNIDNEEAMLERMIALSLDPKEQQNQEAQSFVQALKESQQLSALEKDTSSRDISPLDDEAAADIVLPEVTSEIKRPTPMTSEQIRQQIEADEDLARVLEMSRQEFQKGQIKDQIKEHLETEKAIRETKHFKGEPRPIIVDGNNVAFNHSNHTYFSARALLLVYQYFEERGHDITIFCTLGHKMSDEDKDWCQRLSEAGILKPITKRKYGVREISHYDDLFILSSAKESGGIIVSNDKFRDVIQTHPHLTDIITNNVLSFQFVNDHFIPAEDPLGRNGPNLQEFLKF